MVLRSDLYEFDAIFDVSFHVGLKLSHEAWDSRRL